MLCSLGDRMRPYLNYWMTAQVSSHLDIVCLEMLCGLSQSEVMGLLATDCSKESLHEHHIKITC